MPSEPRHSFFHPAIQAALSPCLDAPPNAVMIYGFFAADDLAQGSVAPGDWPLFAKWFHVEPEVASMVLSLLVAYHEGRLETTKQHQLAVAAAPLRESYDPEETLRTCKPAFKDPELWKSIADQLREAGGSVSVRSGWRKERQYRINICRQWRPWFDVFEAQGGLLGERVM